MRELISAGTSHHEEVALALINRAHLPAEPFLSVPFSNDPQVRMYETGDLCDLTGNDILEPTESSLQA